jgi:16S rRNA (guanine(966)-N(2))-methyltransferase RsmD
MRIISGNMGGRKLRAPEGMGTRPILDRVKAALFDVLGARLAMPGELPAVDVLDIFCGGGSLGIESLSRGAASCTFVEAERTALACLRDNITTLGLSNKSHVVSSSAERAVIPNGPCGAYGLIFLDPPYRMSEDGSSGSTIARIFHRLGSDVPVTPDVMLAWRFSSDCQAGTRMGGWQQVERRSWGTMSIAFMTFDRGDGR